MNVAHASRRRSDLDIAIFKPLVRAYALGHLSSTAPRLFGLLRTFRRGDKSTQQKLDQLYTILRSSTQVNRFPATCAVIVGGATLLPRLITAVLFAVFKLLSKRPALLLSPQYFRRLRFVCTFLASLLAFNLLNRDKNWNRQRARSNSSAQVDQTNLRSSYHQQITPPDFHPHYAGKTIDFTLFALFRALDVLAITLWTRTRSKPWHPEQHHPKLAKFVKSAADPVIFTASTAIIMWSWFYAPHRLPRAYNRWIDAAASIDQRLIHLLRLARQGDIVYGQETGHAGLLGSLCRDLRLPEEWGDPAKTIPVPCELVHTGTGPSCEVHGLSRFLRSWRFAMNMYLPLQLVIRLRSPSAQSLWSAVLGAARSSAFLGAFVAMFYYSVCLARTRLGPKIFARSTVTPMMWDSGLCVLAGCLTCGWSILLEKPSRRQEIAFFVGPRALATLLPRAYDKQYRRREQMTLALSVAVVLNAVNSGDGRHVRGVFGRILERVLRE